MGDAFVSSAQAKEVEDGLGKLEVEEVKVVGADAAASTFGDEATWIYGEDNGVAVGEAENNWLFHTGYGEVFGEEGDDVLIGLFPTVLKKGNKIGHEPADGLEDTRSVAEKDLKLVLNGGAGNDWVISVLGDEATTIGGNGRDWIFNTSAGGVLYGDLPAAGAQSLSDPRRRSPVQAAGGAGR